MPSTSTTVSSSIEPQILSLVLSVLVELHPETQILECTPIPGDRYAIRLEIPREVGKAVLIPRRLLERALVDPSARRTVRNVVRTAARLLRSQRAISDSRASRATERLRTWTGPRCAACDGSLFAEDPVMLELDVRKHLACPPGC